ncbi:endothelin-converting enzyme 2-like [Tropilaelaps mercedesae]|uniref:Endothelin-converting enzyme 2-like n=1 Tax=Tropilaelaps mercedesae TaxID=418985 RepID=A0A1V9XFT2_9ACAR|nr:endothelin-converting enzyme 2-like [Tropilaelaps mercedesae]
MNGIQLKPAARYKRASFDEDDVSAGGGGISSGLVSGVGAGSLGGGISPALDGSSTVLNVGHDPSRPSISLSGVHFRKRSALCGYRCTKVELCLTVLVALLSGLLGAVVFMGTNGFIRGTHVTISTHALPGVCLAPECVTVASAIISSMNHKVNPCDDFYEFACGGWVKQNPLPDGKSIWSTFGKLWQENQLVMKNILDDDSRPLNSSAERLAKTYYLSCLDRNDTIESLGSTPIDELLTQLGGWNISSSGFNPTSWKLQSSIELAQNTFSRGVFFAWMVAPDERNSSRHIITLDQGGLTLPSRDYYLNKTDREKTVTALKQYIAQALYNKMSIADLQQLAPFLDWLSFFRSGFSMADHVTDMIGFPSFLSDHTKLDAKFEGLEMKEAEYFNNNLRISQWMLLKNMRRLQRTSQRGEWDMSPIQVNAYYTPSKNQIVFPAGILQAPFYDKNYPRSLNFGAMGVVMGHELTHAFDDQGREYDKEGEQTMILQR